MFNFFNSNVFVEIGEAIGNVGRALFHRHHRSAELVDQAFQRRLRGAPTVVFPLVDEPIAFPGEDVIDASFTIVWEEKDGQGDV
jgi:hypothetical protein